MTINKSQHNQNKGTKFPISLTNLYQREGAVHITHPLLHKGHWTAEHLLVQVPCQLDCYSHWHFLNESNFYPAQGINCMFCFLTIRAWAQQWNVASCSCSVWGKTWSLCFKKYTPPKLAVFWVCISSFPFPLYLGKGLLGRGKTQGAGMSHPRAFCYPPMALGNAAKCSTSSPTATAIRTWSFFCYFFVALCWIWV